MAEFKAILKVNDKGNGEIDKIKSNFEQINISRNPYQKEFDFDFRVGNTPTPYQPTVADYSEIGDNTRILNEYDGYLFRAESGVPLTLELTGRNIINLSFEFDSVLGNYPQDIEIIDLDGTVKTMQNNGYLLEIKEMVAGYGTKTIKFSNWINGTLYVNIKAIRSFETEITLTKDYITSFSSQTQFITSAKSVFYGITSATGSLELNDYDNSIYQKALMGYMDANTYTLYLYLNDNLVQVHTGYEAPLYNADQSIDLSLSSKLNNIYNLVADEDIYLMGSYSGYAILYNVYVEIMNYFGFDQEEIENSTSQIINVGSDEVQNDMSVKDYLLSICIPLSKPIYVCMKKGENLSDILSAICEVAQLELTLDENGKLMFYNGRPLMTAQEKASALNITYGMQRTALTYDIMVSNKYDSAEISIGGNTGSGGGSTPSGGSSSLDNLPLVSTVSSNDQVVVLVGNQPKKINVSNYEESSKTHEPIGALELDEILV